MCNAVSVLLVVLMGGALFALVKLALISREMGRGNRRMENIINEWEALAKAEKRSKEVMRGQLYSDEFKAILGKDDPE